MMENEVKDGGYQERGLIGHVTKSALIYTKSRNVQLNIIYFFEVIRIISDATMRWYM
jgi:hypothetical protein